MNDIKVELKPGMFWVGVNDRWKDLFEGIWPIPRGISYNSYLILDEQPTLIDTVEEPFSHAMLENIERFIEPAKLKYVVVNHMEPDHSGSLPALLRVAPDVTLVCTAKAKDMLKHFFDIEENIQVVADGEEINIGARTLRFYEIPYVHWPETMATYAVEDQVLFPCDAFGTYGALDGGFFDDEVDVDYYIDEMLRYYANIVAMYSQPVQKALAKLDGLPIGVLAPSHGPIWRKDVGRVVELYRRWSNWEGEKGVALFYGSMYGNTLEMMEAVARGVVKGGCRTLRVYDVSRVPFSYCLAECWRWRGIILGAPTYDTGVYIPMDNLMRTLEHKRLRNRVCGIFGSYSWAGGATKKMREMIEGMKWELVEPVLAFTSHPTPDQLAQGEALGQAIAQRVMAD